MDERSLAEIIHVLSMRMCSLYVIICLLNALVSFLVATEGITRYSIFTMAHLIL
jgi:hypothetical protein